MEVQPGVEVQPGDVVEQLRRWRAQHGVSQAVVARELDVTVATIGRWERRVTQPSHERTARLSGMLTNARKADDVVDRDHLKVLEPDRSMFVGRESELAVLASVWPGCRLLTLTGPGGVGKSRLAVELLRRSNDPVLGVVQLDTVHDVKSVPEAFAGALRLHTNQHATAALVCDALKRRTGVVLVDTCEHFAAEVTELFDLLLRETSDIRILATSQRRIPVRGGRTQRVRPLGLPEAGADDVPASSLERHAGPTSSEATVRQRADAVRLFVVRARERSPDCLPGLLPAAVAEICRRLEGVPLQIELAAAWMDTMSPEQLLEHWDRRTEMFSDRSASPARQRSAADAIDWSASLLDRGSRDLLVRCGVFAGPFTLDDVNAVAASADDVPEQVRQLVDISLFEYSPTGMPHYRMLDSVRGWASTQLEITGQARSAWSRLLLHLIAISEAAARDSFSGRHAWSERLELAAPMIGSSLAWAVEHDRGCGLELAVTLTGWWRRAGRHAEGRLWLEQLTEDGRDGDVRVARGRCALAVLCADLGDDDTATQAASSSLEVLDGAGDTVWTVRALTALSRTAHARGDTSAAREFADRALAATAPADPYTRHGRRADADRELPEAHDIAAGVHDAYLDVLLQVDLGDSRALAAVHDEPLGRGRSAMPGQPERADTTPSPFHLTPAEIGVVRQLLSGKRDAEIASALAIGTATVATHLRHIRDKFGVRNRTQIVLRALDAGFQPVDPPAAR